MPCGKRPLVKAWDKPRRLRVVTPSRYEQNEAHVKVHWKNVVKELESSYKDEQFWETNSKAVKELVGPVIFQRISKIFDLPVEEEKYAPKEDRSTILPSEQYYVSKEGVNARPKISICEFVLSEQDVEGQHEEESEAWTLSSVDPSDGRTKQVSTKSLSSSPKLRSKSEFIAKASTTSESNKKESDSDSERSHEDDSLDESGADMHVRRGSKDRKHLKRQKRRQQKKGNPYFDMLYCNASETDMIKWKSKYKQKTFEISASDEFSKRAEIMTKKICNDFFKWWTNLGNDEFKSEIKRPEDIEDLFQVWFDEHASRGIAIDPKIIPCVIKSIATHANVQKASCLNALKRQIAYDVHAETRPAHMKAFGSSLPHRLKHIPPQNDTSDLWHGARIPEDLRSMACVWEDIQHLTSTKSFQLWLVKHPHLSMPPFLKKLNAPGGDKKQPFTVPSDFVRDMASASTQDLALPVSKFTLELKEVLSKLMNQ